MIHYPSLDKIKYKNFHEKNYCIWPYSFVCLCQVFLDRQPEKKQYQATQISTPPVINGILDDDIWQTGDWVDDFTQNEPYNGRKASQRTEFKILFDDNNLYVAIKALRYQSRQYC